MAATWRLMLSHNVAHLNPTLTTGTAVAGYPFGSIRTLNPNERGRVVEATNRVDLDFDRGAATGKNAVNCLFMAGCTYSSFAAVQALDCAASDFGAGTFNELVDDAAVSLNTYTPRLLCFTALATSALRYLRFSTILTASDTFEYGTVSFGVQYELGNELLGGTESANGDGSVTFTKTFRKPSKLTTANVAAIMALYEKPWIYNSTNSALDGWGPAASASEGPRPVVLAKFASSTDLSSTVAYYGVADIRSNEWAANYSELQITMTTIPLGPLH
ncbi:MAG: hypothetical protein WC683_09890 [bacterium]